MSNFERLVLWFITLYIREKLEDRTTSVNMFDKLGELQNEINNHFISVTKKVQP